MNGNTKLWTDGLINDNSVKSLTRELNQMFRRYGINTCIQKITFLAQVNAETGFFKLSQEKPSKYKSSTSFYKGRGLIQLTGNLNKDGTAYSVPGPYEKYGKYLADNGYLKKEEEGIFISDPDLISKDLHYAIDSAGWEWSIEKKALSYIRDYGDKEKNAYAKWKRDTFPKGVGKSLDDIALAYEETIEEEKYFWFQSKILNGYLLTHKDKPDPHGWEKRKEGLRKLKTWFKYDKAVCRGEKELEFISGKGRAPWMETAIQEIINYGGKHEKAIDKRIREYHKAGGISGSDSGVPWCASFVSWCLENSTPKFESPHSASSSMFFNHSALEPCEAFFGTIAVFSDCYSNGKMKGSGHITLVYGKLLDKNTYIGLVGNQGNMITLSPNYKFDGSTFYSYTEKGIKIYKKLRGFFKPKGYVIKEEDKLNKNDEYATINEANKKLNQKTQDTSKGESSR